MSALFRRLAAALLALAALVLIAPAQAAPPQHMRAELAVESAGQPGGQVWLAFHLTPDAGWHGYWRNPGDAGLGLSPSWTLPAGAAAGELQYPVPGTLLLSGLMNHVYEQDYAVLVPLTLPASAAPGSRVPVRVKLDWLACTEQICVPQSADLAADIAVGPPGARDARFDQWRAAMPAPLGSKASFAIDAAKVRIAVPLPAAVKLENPHLFVGSERTVDYAAPQNFFRDGNRLVIELPRAKIQPLSPPALDAVLRLDRQGNGLTIEAAPGTVPTGGTPLNPAPATPPLGWLLVSALLGGLLLNVMPCVFPILSLKALSLARAGESDSQARAEGWAYSAGVILACLALGGLLLALRAAGAEVGWAFQLQEPLVVAGLLLLSVTITANLFGLFEFAVPGFAQSGSPQGAFATGLLAAFVATPCTGPFMAAAMGAALLLPAPEALALFAALGLGLALPFLLIAEVPAVRHLLPRPGAWMNWFRKGMALPMGLTALALAWLASRLAGSGFAFAAVLVALIVTALLVLLGRRQRHGLAAGGRWWAMLAGVLVFAALGLPGMVREGGAAESSVLPSKPFSEDALAAARAAGKPVFVYMTADWCLTCKVNESAAIEREETRAAFDKAGVVVLRGDWTRRDPAITRYLTAQGAAGVPLYMWYPAKGEPRQLPQVLTAAQLAELVR